MIQAHRGSTDSAVAAKILENWQASLGMIVKVIREEYKKALAR